MTSPDMLINFPVYCRNVESSCEINIFSELLTLKYYSPKAGVFLRFRPWCNSASSQCNHHCIENKYLYHETIYCTFIVMHIAHSNYNQNESLSIMSASSEPSKPPSGSFSSSVRSSAE